MPAVRAATPRAIHWCGLVGLRAAGLRAALGERPSCEQMRCRHLLPTRRHIALARMSRCRPGVRQRVALAANLTASGRSCELCARTARVSHDQRAVWTASLAASGRSCCVLVEPASSLVIRRRSVETWGQVESVARFFKLPVETLRGEWPVLRALWRATLAASCSPPICCKRVSQKRVVIQHFWERPRALE